MEIVKLTECCTSISDGDHQPPPKADTGIPFITISNFSDNEIDYSGCMFVPEDYYNSIAENRRATKGDILYSVVGSFGIPVLLKDNNQFVFQRHIAILKPNTNKVLPEYLYYILKSPSFYKVADAYAVGTAQRTIGLNSLRRIKVMLPTIGEQKSVVEKLSSYDSLIENNNKRIKILEQMAENLYQEWFVRFRFPGYENVKFENGIPFGFEYKKFSEVCSSIRGLSYSSDQIEDVSFPHLLINLKNIRDYGGFRKNNYKTYNGDYKQEQVVNKNDLVMAVTEMVQERRIIGYTGLIPSYGKTCIISADLIKIVSDIDNLFLYSMFTYGGASKCFSQYGNGTNVIHLKPSAISNVKLLIPNTELSEKYCGIVKPIFENIDNLQLQNDNLIKQRDLLLPRLMSGKLPVK